MGARNLAALAVLLCAVAANAAQPVDPQTLPAPRGARGESALDAGTPRLRARLLVDAPAAEGGAWRAGVLFDLDPGWYLYWRHPGDTGLPTRLELATEGEVGALAWPAPAAFAEDDLVSYGYPEQVLLAAEVRPARPGARVRARADVLVCESQCLPARFELERALEPEPDARVRARLTALFDAAADAVPRVASESGVEVEARWHEVPRAEGERLDAVLRVTRCGPAPAACAGAAPAAAVPLFVFEPAQWLVRATLIGVDEGGGLAIRLAGEALPGSEPDARELRGVLPLRAADGTSRPVEIALPLPARHAAQAPAAAPVGLGAWLRALLFGFAGGIVLNLMPCVLPVLALKGVALAELAQRSRREVFGHALAYTAGIQLTLGALALCVLGLRASGQAVGWGFQLQEPIFVAAIAILLVTFATNLFGAFEISFAPDRLARVGADAHGAARSFFDGLLAVVLATPCSAPFLGTAVGFAFASSAPICVAIFAAIGFGLAAPFVAIALWPGLARRMPRGGSWMLELRQGLAFALLLTVVWLLWITGRQSGVDAAAGLSALLLCVAGVGWLYGLAQRARGHLAPGVLVGAIAAIVLVGHGRIELTPQHVTPGHESARPYSRAALEAALAEGRPAFVYFTADWCLTCKLNERRVLDTPRARAELARLGFAVFRADWTRRDAVIAGELARLGRAGVPVYALYAPGADAPRLLPDLLSPDAFDVALRETAGAATRVAGERAVDALR